MDERREERMRRGRPAAGVPSGPAKAEAPPDGNRDDHRASFFSFFLFHFLLFSSQPSSTPTAQMSSNVPISGAGDITAPTPQNTPLNQAPIALGLSRPTVPDISEDNENEDGAEGEGPSLAGLEEPLLGMVHGKLADLVGKSSGYIESLPVEIKLNVEALKGVQVKQNELHQQYKKECLELEKKVRCSFS